MADSDLKPSPLRFTVTGSIYTEDGMIWQPQFDLEVATLAGEPVAVAQFNPMEFFRLLEAMKICIEQTEQKLRMMNYGNNGGERLQ